MDRRPHTFGDGGLIVVECAVERGTCLSRVPLAGKKAYYVLEGAPELTDRDVAKARAAVDPSTGEPVVVVEFNARGRRAFHEVTRRQANRGRRLCHRGTYVLQCAQHLAIVVRREIVAAPYIDFVRNPDGIPGYNGAQIPMASLREARELARDLNTP